MIQALRNHVRTIVACNSSMFRTALPALLIALATNGCAAITNPVADGIPVSRVPPELLAESREDQLDIPPSLLRRKKDEVYRLAPGDVLAVFIEGVLGDSTQALPVRPSDTEDEAPAVGFPVPVRENGTIALPQASPIQVRGMSIPEAEAAIRKAFTIEKKIVQPQEFIIVLSLARKRKYNVLVIRQDGGGTTSVSSNALFGRSSVTNNPKRGTGQVVYLAEGENDVITALARTGGLPGLDAVNEVLVERKSARNTAGVRGSDSTQPVAQTVLGAPTNAKPEYIRIPLRLKPGEPLPFTQEDIILHDGDIVYIAARSADVFFTAGLLGSAQFTLPRDTDLDVVQALAIANAPLINGSFGGSNLSGANIAMGLGFPNPSRLSVIRKTADNHEFVIKVDLNEAFRTKRERILVQTGDILVLQQTPGEAFANYLTQVIRIGYTGNFLRAPNYQATVTGVLP